MELRDIIKKNYETILANIVKTGRNIDEVTIVAVTKGRATSLIEIVNNLGLYDIGENYAGELVKKNGILNAALNKWHFLGRLQLNKFNKLAPIVTCYHGVMRKEELVRLKTTNAKFFIQINFFKDSLPNRNGASEGELEDLVQYCFENELNLAGFMCLGAQGGPDYEKVNRTIFRRCFHLTRKYGLQEMSCGMSEDYMIALEEGATTIRIGRALFKES